LPALFKRVEAVNKKVLHSLFLLCILAGI
jgi:hypothetical protein